MRARVTAPVPAPASRTFSGRPVRACTGSVSRRASAAPLGAMAPVVRRSRAASMRNVKPSAVRGARTGQCGVVQSVTPRR